MIHDRTEVILNLPSRPDPDRQQQFLIKLSGAKANIFNIAEMQQRLRNDGWGEQASNVKNLGRKTKINDCYVG